MNMPVVPQQAPQLPAYLANRDLTGSVSSDALGGLSSNAVHKISIEGKRWKLQDPQGQEYPVQQFHLDVIIVGVNPHVSKTFYASKWVHGQDQKAPDCWSDNGVGPSSRATAPQCGMCQQCPNNAWGSRISEAGSQVKACVDSKKLAVILADNPTGAIYQLRVPADSLKNLATAAKSLGQQKMGLEYAVMRLTFDEAVPHPKIVFSPLTYVSEQQYAVVEDLKGTEDVADVTNVTDVVRTAPIAQIAQQPMSMPPAAQAPQAPQFAPQPVPQYQPAPQPVQPVAMPQAPVFAAPPVAPQAPAAQPQAFNPMAPAANAAAAPAPRKRRTKTQIAAEAAQQADANAAAIVNQGTAVNYTPQMQPQAPVYQAPAGIPAAVAPHPVAPNFQMAQPVGAPVPQAPTPTMPPMPAFLQRTQDAPGAVPAAAAVPVAPQPTDSALDNLLGKAMGG